MCACSTGSSRCTPRTLTEKPQLKNNLFIDFSFPYSREPGQDLEDPLRLLLHQALFRLPRPQVQVEEAPAAEGRKRKKRRSVNERK